MKESVEWLRPPRGTEEIERGSVVRDVRTGRIGVLQDVTPYMAPYGSDQRPQVLAFLRPLGGGREWTTLPDQLLPVTDSEG